jgi:hypothetical protein
VEFSPRSNGINAPGTFVREFRDWWPVSDALKRRAGVGASSKRR